MESRLTHMGSATLLIQAGELRILTDPAFCPVGTEHRHMGMAYRRVRGPTKSSLDVGRVDLVLVTSDRGDHLDSMGELILEEAGHIVTPVPVARRLERSLGREVVGLRPWEAVDLEDGTQVTAVPVRHGRGPLLDSAVGFALQWPGSGPEALYVSGDTLYHRRLREIRDQFPIGTAILHGGSERLGPIRASMSGRAMACLVGDLQPGRVIPVHYDGWTHYRTGRADIEEAFAQAGLSERLLWLEPGKETAVELHPTT